MKSSYEREYIMAEVNHLTWEHSGTTREDSVGVQIFTDIDIALHDAVVSGFVDSGGFHTEEGWLEEGFWTSESFVSNSDNLQRKISRWFQNC